MRVGSGARENEISPPGAASCRQTVNPLGPALSRRTVVEGDVIFEPGVRRRSLFVVLKGRLEGTIPASGGENRITILEAGDFTGEVHLLSGRPSLVRTRALTESELLEIDVATLRSIVQTDTELSETFLRAFVRRRAMLIAKRLEVSF